MAGISLLTVSLLGGCNLFRFNFHTSGDFMYTLNGQYAIILQFSEQGKEKEVIIVPKEIDGYPIVQYGDNLRGIAPPPVVYMESEKLKRLYFTDSNFKIDEYCALRKCLNLQYIFYVGTAKDGTYVDWINKGGDSLILTSKNCDVYVYYQIYKNMYGDNKRTHTLPGNVTYYYNYEGSPNDGYYWLDNYDYGEKIQYPPENPAREGFMFYGWYKEAECVNKWEFETDALPDSLPDGNGGEVYQETKLFAKWIAA